jgi:hypothetical protein
MFLVVTILSSCGSDDKITNDKTSKLFAQLLITRFRSSQGGVLMIADSIFASFDSTYSPIIPVKPCSLIRINCNSYSLEWQEEIQRHLYTDNSNEEGFLGLGTIYIFKTDSGQAVPAFEKSIRFPSEQPRLTYPLITPPPNWLDTISLANGFTITWQGTGPGAVELIICDAAVAGYYPEDTLARVVTENDGSVTLAPADLVGLAPDQMYKIIMIIKNSEAIISEGYDPRSSVTAQMHTFSTFYAM